MQVDVRCSVMFKILTLTTLRVFGWVGPVASEIIFIYTCFAYQLGNAPGTPHQVRRG